MENCNFVIKIPISIVQTNSIINLFIITNKNIILSSHLTCQGVITLKKTETKGV